MFGRKNTQGDGRYSRLTPQKVLRICEAKFLGHKKPSLGTKMQSVAKRMASETVARMLAVTAMLVIAGLIFYSR
jgi:hypothetical protein